MPGYPKALTEGDQKRHYDVFARLRVITSWDGFAEQQRERRQWLRAWLEDNTDLSKSELDNATPVNFCDLPQPDHDAGKQGARQEAAFISEREVWWIYDELGEQMQAMKSDNRDWLEQRRQDVKGEHPDRFKHLSIATKHDPQFSDWKKTHDPTTGKPKPKSDWRSKSQTWHNDHLGITEQPANSNCDNRSDGIRTSQTKCAGGATWLQHEPWCGVWAFRGLLAGDKVKADGSASWLASVAQIEDYARQGKGPFKGWTTDGDKAQMGDLVVLFGRGVHVGTVRNVTASTCETWEGNTSGSDGGSQSNGGGSYKRDRSRSYDVYGYALVE